MDNQVVVDTDIASYIFNWHSTAQRHVDSLRGAELILSFMSIAEMRVGAIAAGPGLRRRNLLEQFIGGFGVEYANDVSCTRWATLRSRARATGRMLSPQDAWIAATALGLDAGLATNNRKDFEHLKGIRLLPRI